MNIEQERGEKLNSIYKKYGDCDHSKTEVRIRTFKNGSIHYVNQCIVCGHAGTSISKHAALSLNIELKPFDDDLQSKREQQRNAEIEMVTKEYGTKKEANRQDFLAWYNSYLNSQEWKRKRNLVLKRDNYICQGCLLSKATQVHHLTYKHVGEELLFELVSICDTCHEVAHRDDPDSSVELFDGDGF